METIEVTQEPEPGKDPSVIPPGYYCYRYTGESRPTAIRTPAGKLVTVTMPEVKACPYWSIDPNKPEMNNGHCAFLNVSDGDKIEGGGAVDLLWDQVKFCGENEDEY